MRGFTTCQQHAFTRGLTGARQYPAGPALRCGWRCAERGVCRTKLGQQRADGTARHEFQEDVEALVRAVRALPQQRSSHQALQLRALLLVEAA